MLTLQLGSAVAGMSTVAYAAGSSIATFIVVVLLWRSFARLRHLRIVEDTPTARIGSAPQGFVELEGTAEALRGTAQPSPLLGIPCVWWCYRIEDLDVQDLAETLPGALIVALAWVYDTLRLDRRGKVVESGRSHERFLLRDESGACIVDPASARIVGARKRIWFRGRRRFEESIVPAGAPLYALGLFRTPQDHAAILERREAGRLVSAWKLNQLELVRRFDRNRDGTIDDLEWSACWDAALREVRRGATPPPDLHVLCQPKDRRPFLLSLTRQRRVAAQLWFQSFSSLLGAGIVGVILAWSAQLRGLF